MTKQSSEPALEVTAAMKEAGVQELFEGFRLGGDWGDLVTQIFIAMAIEARQQQPQSS